MNKIKILHSLEHILVYGYFQHAFELYLSSLKPKDIQDIEVVEMKNVFRDIRHKLRNGTYLAPNILGQREYPIEIKMTNDEFYWFNKIIKLNFKKVLSGTKKYFKENKKQDIILYSELYNNFRTDAAIEFLHKSFLKNLKNQKSSSLS